MTHLIIAASKVTFSVAIKYILIAVGIAGALLLLGFFIRSKVKFLQRIFLPASVIGGFIGLILGSQVLGKLIPGYWSFINLEWLKCTSMTYVEEIFSALPGVLIIPIFAATPLGNFAKKKTKEEKAAARAKGETGITFGLFFLLMGMMVVQSLIGYGVNLVTQAIAGADSIYAQFGYEVAVGFVGGHGTAASISALYGSTFVKYHGEELGATVTSMSQAMGVTFATIGLVGGMILGITFINIASRKGLTSVMKEPVKLEGEQLTGIHKDIATQESVGRQTVKNFTIEAITVHIAIICLVCVAAYLSVKLLGKVPNTALATVLGSLPVWSLAMLYMFGVNALLKALKLEWLIDRKLISRLTGSMTDIAIVCAVASMNLTAVFTYWPQIIACAVIAFVVTYFYIFKFTKLICKDEAPFEHSIIAWGACTGVMMTGLMLLKICDPNFETKALNNFTKSFAAMSLAQTALFLFYIAAMMKGTVALTLFNGILAVVFTAGIIVVVLLSKKKKVAKA